MSPHVSRPGLVWVLPVFALLVGVLGAAAIWLGLRLGLRGLLPGWGLVLAPLLALDLVLMLRLAGAPRGRLRATLAVLGTALAIAFGYWTVVAADLGRALGLSVLESMQRLGPALFLSLVEQGTEAWEYLLALCSLALAWWLAR
jgi:hypothetical protein